MINKSLLDAQKMCNEGVSYMEKNYYSKALNYFDKVQPIFQEENNLSWLAYLYQQKFICYMRLERISESQELAQKIIDTFKKENNKKALVGFLLNYSELWQKQKDLIKALHYAKISESMANIYKAQSYLPFIYLRLGDIYKDYRIQTKAIFYFKKAIDLFSDEVQTENKGYCLSELANIYKEIFLIDEALDAYQTAAKIYLKVDNQKSAIENLENFRKIQLELGNIEKAKQIEKQIIKIGNKILKKN